VINKPLSPHFSPAVNGSQYPIRTVSIVETDHGFLLVRGAIRRSTARPRQIQS
jgi:hypothetical protein